MFKTMETTPQVFSFGTRRVLEPGAAWATINIGNAIRLKRTNIPLFQLQVSISKIIKSS